MIEVRRVEPDEWALLRDVRLRALLDAPSAFASTYAREVVFGEAEWRARIDGGSGAAARLVEAVCAWAADDGGRVVSLWVADGNGRARRFYERLGFAATGDRQPLPSDPRIGEERLERALLV